MIPIPPSPLLAASAGSIFVPCQVALPRVHASNEASPVATFLNPSRISHYIIGCRRAAPLHHSIFDILRFDIHPLLLPLLENLKPFNYLSSTQKSHAPIPEDLDYTRRVSFNTDMCMGGLD
jgi:hypothetical protein